jgi:phosphoribosylamine--glycine ligase
MTRVNVLVLGSGGREHALCHALSASPRLGRLFILPGNAGTEQLGTNVSGDPSDVDRVLEVARREDVGLTIVGPEEPLALGVVDALQQAGRLAFGPTRAAASLESDKVYAKQLMRQHAVPTAEWRDFSDYDSARHYIATRDEPLVVKAAGLAKGKGVIVCDEPADAILAAERMLNERAFGPAGARIVVEERLLGREVSLLALVDGATAYLLEPAQDYKRLRDGDAGPNTGGMGAYSPSSTIGDDVLHQIQEQILVPTLNALVHEGVQYRGVLYLGLMLTPGGPKVLEFNCRFGDPETQVLMMRLRSDLLDALEATATGRLEELDLHWDARHALCVVMASRGYPHQSESDVAISGLPLERGGDVVVFHAGTRRASGHAAAGRRGEADRRAAGGDEAGPIVTAAGRVLGVTALGDTLEDARREAYRVVESIHFAGAQFRRDIGA